MNRTIFLIVGQNMDYDFNPKGMSPHSVLDYLLTHNLTHDKTIEFYQSTTDHYFPRRGRVAYELVNGKFQYHSSKIDSSG